MYPLFEIAGSGIFIYTFWITITLCFFAFLFMQKKLCHRYWINTTFFTNRILAFFLSTFIFSRLFYLISKWDDFKYIKDPYNFFIMSEFNFSLIWAIFWFLLVLFLTVKAHKLKPYKYIDTVVISFIFTLPLWYIGAFLWWQVYWNDSLLFWKWITYNSIYSNVPYAIPTYPLPLIYFLATFALFCALYILSVSIKIKWLVWYLWLILLSWLFLFFQQYSWREDFFSVKYWLDITQIWSVFLIIFWIIGLLKLSKEINTQNDNEI